MGVVRTGIGFDVHPFAVERPLMLGGVEIEHDRGLEGHSDGDAVLHAIADAMLGAAALGDIGHLFPPDEPQYRGADSRELLREVARRVGAEGWKVSNVDVTVLAETPRIAPHIAKMTATISGVLAVEPDRVNVKATTLEGLGALGRGDGIACLAVTTLEPDG